MIHKFITKVLLKTYKYTNFVELYTSLYSVLKCSFIRKRKRTLISESPDHKMAPCYLPRLKNQVLSPLRGLTAVFGMGTGVSLALWAPIRDQFN